MGFSGATYGSSFISGDLSADPLVGVLAGSSSPLGSGNAGYVGGAGTGLDLTSTPGSLGLSIFPSGSGSPVQLIGSATPIISLGVDFAVERNGVNANNQSFYFSIFDALGAVESSNFAYDSLVYVNPSNEVFTEANQFAPSEDTGISLSDDVGYHLQTTVDYDTATWSAVLSQGGHSFDIVDDASINVAGYTLSGFTTPAEGWANVLMYADPVSSSNNLFSDRLVFDNYTVSAVPEPPACLVELCIVIFSLVVFQRCTRQRRFLASG